MAAWRARIRDDRVELFGELRRSDATAVWRTLTLLASSNRARMDLDLSRVSLIDGRVMALLVELRARFAASGTACEVIAPDAMRPLVRLFGGDIPALRRASAPVKRPWLDHAGVLFERAGRRVKEPLSFLGELAEGLAQIVRSPRRANWRSLPGLVERAGADAIVIVLLLDFLVGLVIALQAMGQLETFGANVYVADLVGISVTRELAPLMTAIIMSGRSGAAFAAELGTMQVTEEIDALETMGIAPVPYLVVPRVVALVLVAPVLVLIGDAAAILGGLVIAVSSLELTTEMYFSELRTALVPSDVWTGLLKGTVYAFVIATIGCQEGLAARGAAAGVGRRTTATVVAGSFAIVLIDAVLTLVFRAVGV